MFQNARMILILLEHTETCTEKTSSMPRIMKQCVSRELLNNGDTVVVTLRNKSWLFMDQQVVIGSPESQTHKVNL